MTKGTFDMLNDALFAQLDRLAAASDEEVEAEIKRSNAVAQLASNINNNMANAVKVANILAMEGVDIGGVKASLPGMLAPHTLHEPNWEVVDPFITANAPGHTASYIADRLRSQGVDIDFDGVMGRCAALGVSPKDISAGVDWKDAEDEKWARKR